MTDRSPFTEDELNLIRGAGGPRDWERGERLMREGSRAEDVLLVESGLVKVTADTANGYSSVLAVRGPGELLGELACVDGGVRSGTVTAIRAGRGVVVRAERFRRLLADHGPLALAVLRGVSGRLRQSDRLRAEHGAYPAATRIARVLADLALCHGEPVSDPLSDAVAVLINQQELAGAAGTSRESVARTIRQLQAAGLVSTARGATVVPDPGALRRWTGD
ncbi:Crp/Fnr family transcriptional regulator [Streptomyces caniscabiei]|uniref:Crp/Fnr family transcriptional regulator n=1 Tax=Streptomyces caniscabiei TaxID=2746961 RepID=UPI001F35FA06|nr:Crp/Fnr family transcriptional regulator [Streptomyces caniscabiei]